MSEIPITLAAAEPLGLEDHFAACPDGPGTVMDIGGRHAKLKVDELAPKDWTHILYLDADTEVTANISFLWEVLEDGWDLVICKNPGKYHLTRNMVRPDNKDECEKTFGILGTDEVMQLNGGVFGYQRNERTKAFFEAWYQEWQKFGKRDQAAMLRALWRVPLKMLVLTSVWNTVPTYDAAETSAGIMHYPMRARRWRGVVHARSDDEEAWKEVRKWEAEQ
jgi:lipopolysaccharide biosynthesis glycosyltransferase